MAQSTATIVNLLALGLAWMISAGPAGSTPLVVDWAALAAPSSGGSQPDAPANEALAGREVKIDGLLLPVDRDADGVHEFVLVAYPGACAHARQPPPNQIVHGFPNAPYPATRAYEPVTVTGVLDAETSVTQIFMLDGTRTLRAAYVINAAQIVSRDAGDGAPFVLNPWSRLQDRSTTR